MACNTITCSGPRLVRTKIPIVYELQCTSQPVSTMSRSRLVSTCTGARAWFETNAHISPSSSGRWSRWWSSGRPGRRRPYWTVVDRVAHSSAIIRTRYRRCCCILAAECVKWTRRTNLTSAHHRVLVLDQPKDRKKVATCILPIRWQRVANEPWRACAVRVEGQSQEARRAVTRSREAHHSGH